MKKVFYKIFEMIFTILGVYILILAFALQFVVPIGFTFIIFDLFLIGFGVFELFIPTNLAEHRFFKSGDYDIMTRVVLLLLALIIIYQHFELVYEVTLGFLGLDK